MLYIKRNLGCEQLCVKMMLFVCKLGLQWVMRGHTRAVVFQPGLALLLLDGQTELQSFGIPPDLERGEKSCFQCPYQL